MNADIMIVGAGIAGVSLAARLAPHYRILLLEAESRPGYHATGRSAAYYAPTYGNAVVRKLTAVSGPFFRDPPAGFSEAPLIHHRAALFVGTGSQVPGLDRLAADHPDLERLDSSAVHDLVPIIDAGRIAGGVLDTAGGDLDVDAILQGFLRQFRSNGGTLLADQPVTSLQRRNGHWHLRAGNASHRAGIIVNAAGAWADHVAMLAGLEPAGIQPLRRSAFLVSAPDHLDIRHWPLTIDIDEGFYFKPDAGRILISPADETPSEPCDAQPEELDIAVAVDRVQAVTNLEISRIHHRWAGLRSFAPDRTFVAGFDPRTEGFFWLAGQGGYGVQTSPAMADLSASILGEKPQLMDVETAGKLGARIKPDRLVRTQE